MAKPFSVETAESRFRFPLRTRQQIRELMDARERDARSILIDAIADAHEREFSQGSAVLQALHDAGGEQTEDVNDKPIII